MMDTAPISATELIRRDPMAWVNSTEDLVHRMIRLKAASIIKYKPGESTTYNCSLEIAREALGEQDFFEAKAYKDETNTVQICRK